MSPTTTERRNDIDGLRAVAVTAVVLFHAGYARFSGGFTGVDVFFVISGFLITGLIRRAVGDGSFTYGGFYLRRGRRLFPALLATVALTFVGSAAILSPDQFVQLAKSAVAALASLANFYFWADSGYFDAAAILKPLLHTWSLSVEEQFYLLWPVVLVIALRRSDRFAFRTLLCLGLVSLLAGWLCTRYTSTVFFLMPFRVFELAAGGILVWLLERARFHRVVEEAGLLIGLAFIGAGIFLTDETTPYPLSGALPTVGAMFVLAFGRARAAGLLLRNPVAAWGGRISYSVYLVHWPIVVLTEFLLARPLEPDERAALVFFAFLLGGVMYWAIEQRFRFARTGSLPLRPYFAAYGAAIAVAGILAGVVTSSGGWTWRLGDRESTYLASMGSPLAKYGGSTCAPPQCEIPGKGRPIYVVGDSHARALLAGLRDATGRPLVYVGANGCPFFSLSYTYQSLTGTEAGAECDRARRDAFKLMRGADVVLTQSWVNSAMIDRSTGATRPLAPAPEFAGFVAEQAAVLQRTLQAHSLLIVGDVPTTGHYAIGPLDCLGRPIVLTGSCDTSVIVPTSIIDVKRSFNRALKAAVVLPAQFFDPIPLLCDEKVCRNIVDGHVLYSDWNHLSVWGSQFLARLMPFIPSGIGASG